MEEKFAAIVIKAADSGEFDKRITLITPHGVRQALMRGVKRPNARLRAAALPLAFFEYTAAKKGDYYTVTGASQIEDLFSAARDPIALTCASIILEAAYAALKSDCAQEFIYMLKRLRDVIYPTPAPTTEQPLMSEHPASTTEQPPARKDFATTSEHFAHLSAYLSAIRFLQYLIHSAGYGYDYSPTEGEIDTPIKLLSALYFIPENTPANPLDLKSDEPVIFKTLTKIIDNFEKKFETEILSKKMLKSL